MAIGVKTQGNTGNQLFQFAFGFSAAKKLGCTFFMDDMEGLRWLEAYDIYDPQSKEVQRKLRSGNRLRRLFSKKDTNKYLGLELCPVNDWSRAEELRLKDNCYYGGYFQSEEFFKSDEDEIRKLFRVKPALKKKFAEDKKQYLGTPYIALHVRRGDYLHWQLDGLGDKDYTLPASYYLNCLKQMGDTSTYKLVFLCNDKDFFEKNFSSLPNAVREYNDPVTDFQLMQNAEMIGVSNSSFAWWAAYLSEKANKVSAPEHWIGFKVKKEFPPAIICDNWQRTSVY